MTQEEKDLLIKDLSARIPYKVKASYYGTDEEMECTDIVEGIIINNNDAEIIIGQYGLPIEKVKPYLFPFSSMTNEQKDEFDSLYTYDALIIEPQIKLINWCYENHFDINGLIPKELANDATGLNIY